MGKQRMKDRDGTFKTLEDPIPEPNQVELQRHGSVERWNEAVLAWRKNELHRRRSNQAGLERMMGTEVRDVESWKTTLGDLKIARNEQQEKIEQMGFVINLVSANIEHAIIMGIEEFQLDADIETEGFGRKRMTSIWRGIRKTKRNPRAERGFAFFDQLMRQSPRPGTIKQEVTKR